MKFLLIFLAFLRSFSGARKQTHLNFYIENKVLSVYCDLFVFLGGLNSTLK